MKLRLTPLEDFLAEMDKQGKSYRFDFQEYMKSLGIISFLSKRGAVLIWLLLHAPLFDLEKNFLYNIITVMEHYSLLFTPLIFLKNMDGVNSTFYIF